MRLTILEADDNFDRIVRLVALDGAIAAALMIYPRAYLQMCRERSASGFLQLAHQLLFGDLRDSRESES